MAGIFPYKLLNKSIIGIFAPSSYVEKGDIKEAKEIFNIRGFEVLVHLQSYQKFNQGAGTEQDKKKAFEDLWYDDAIGAVMAAGGGNRALHLLPHLDLATMAAQPKIFMGFSDCTALLNAFAAKGLITFHGPNARTVAKMQHTEQIDYALDLLQGNTLSYPCSDTEVLKPGKAEGRMLGGNLSVFLKLLGTPYAPDLEGSILFLEDVNDETSWLDRDFWHLRQAGIFDKIRGLILGDFSQNDTGRPYGFTFKDIVREHTQGLDIPVIMNAPFGHKDKLYALPVGSNARLEAETGKVLLEFETPLT